MLIVVVCLFVLCWLPLQIYTFLAEFYEEINEYKYINIIWFCSNWLAMSNSCYNPFIYGLLNEKFKREFRLLFSICPCKGCPKKPEVIRLNDFSDDSDGGRRSVRIQSARNGHQCKNEYIYNKPFFHKRNLNFDLPSQTTLI
ncbi:hypothetical protein ACJMK2_021046 [Sinanodonta woodiana]|uniref:G-protein coupled receptors family 1 profile domain-containing protein n=1 Tax=Sinanodonta woodiana TaxID=1069815 RepID=A0ABD3U0W2_SINWO